MGYQSEVLHCYGQIAPLVDNMLVTAQAGDWGALPAMETQYSNLVDHLKAIEPVSTLDEEQTASKYQLLKRILSAHAEVSAIVTPELAKLGAMLKTLEQKEGLQRAYGLAVYPYS